MTGAHPSVQSAGAANARPSVSVVVVSWNTRDLVRRCLQAAEAAARQLEGPVEIIVVDNASRDATADMVRTEFPGVRLIENEFNAGFAAATNQGIRAGSGRYVLLLNPDTEAAADSFRILVSFLEEHPAAAAAGPRLVGRRGEEQVSCFPLPTLTRELWRLFHLERVRARASYPASRLQGSTPRSVESVQGACLLVRREALDRAGLLDERFFIYTEEIDLCRRLLDRGWEIFWVPAAVVVHYGGASTEQVSARMFLELYRSKVQYFRKHFGAPGALAYKAVLLTAALPRIVLPALGIPFVPARRDRWRGLLSNYSALVAHLHAL